jgi:hypothetical protein
MTDQVTASRDTSYEVAFGTADQVTVLVLVPAIAVPATVGDCVGTGVASCVGVIAVANELVETGLVPMELVKLRVNGMVRAVAEKYVCTYELAVDAGPDDTATPSTVRFIAVSPETGVHEKVTVPTAGVTVEVAASPAGARGAVGTTTSAQSEHPVRV